MNRRCKVKHFFRLSGKFQKFCLLYDQVHELVFDKDDLDDGLAGCLVDADLVHAGALPLYLDACLRKGDLYKFPHGTGLVGGNDVIVRRILLQHQPHCPYIVLGVTPVPLCVHVPQLNVIQNPLLDPCHSVGDLPGHELLASSLGFMVEQNAGACKQAVAFPVVLGDPVAVQLCDPVGASGVEGSGFALGHCLYQSEHFRGGCLIEPAGGLDSADSLQHVGHADGVDLCGCQGLLPAGCHKGLCRQVVHLVRLGDPHCVDQGDLIGHVRIDKVQLVLDSVDINCDTSAALYVKAADKIFVTLASDSENTLSNTNDFVAIDDNNIDAVIFSKDDLTLNGSGTLTVTAKYGHGIVSKDDLVITSGTYQITAAKHALSGQDSVRIADGILTLNAGTDGIHSENTDDDTKGFIYIANGDISITADSDGFDAEETLQVDGGNIEVYAGDDGLHSDDDLIITAGTINVTKAMRGWKV